MRYFRQQISIVENCMSKYIWLLVFLIPIWAAIEFDAPKWVSMLCSAPFFLRAATLGNDPDEYLLGEGFAQHRPIILVGLVVGGLAMAAGLLMLAKALF